MIIHIMKAEFDLIVSQYIFKCIVKKYFLAKNMHDD